VPWPSLFSPWPVQPRFFCLNSRNRCLAACFGCSVNLASRVAWFLVFYLHPPSDAALPDCFYLPLSLLLFLFVDKPLVPSG
jgi:hypothetical protein